MCLETVTQWWRHLQENRPLQSYSCHPVPPVVPVQLPAYSHHPDPYHATWKKKPEQLPLHLDRKTHAGFNYQRHDNPRCWITGKMLYSDLALSDRRTAPVSKANPPSRLDLEVRGSCILLGDRDLAVLEECTVRVDGTGGEYANEENGVVIVELRSQIEARRERVDEVRDEGLGDEK